jgi:hypothetical protein
VILLLTLACTGDDEPLVFPAGLAALATNTAPLPDDESETFHTVSGEEYEYDWVHGQGYIHASLADVWLAFQDLEVVVDRAAVHEYDFTGESDAAFDVSFQVHNLIYDLVTVEYERDWRESVVAGTIDAPEVVGIRFEKLETTEGLDVIPLMVGSVILTETDDGNTHLDIVEEMIALQRGPEPILQYIEDLYDDARAFSKGETLPERSAPE